MATLKSSKTASKTAGKPARKTAPETAPKPALKAAAKKGSKPVPKGAAKSSTKSTAKPAPRPAPRPAPKPAPKSARKPALKPAPKPAAKPVLLLLQVASGKAGAGKASRTQATTPFVPKRSSRAAGPALPQLDAIEAVHRDPIVRGASLWGVLPADFEGRTGLSEKQLRDIIEANPGHDLYYCSAHPELEGIYHNAWRSPQVTHPQFIDLARAFLKAAGLGDKALDALSHSSLFATGHLMVATPDWWSRYLTFARQVIERARAQLDGPTRKALFEAPAVPGQLSHLALIAARLPGLFLMLRDSRFRAFKVPLAAQEQALNPHLRILREMKDIGLEQSSRWHLNSWAAYRGLYLAHVMGKAWVLKHIQGVTPAGATVAVPVAEVVNPYPRSFQMEGRT